MLIGLRLYLYDSVHVHARIALDDDGVVSVKLEKGGPNVSKGHRFFQKILVPPDHFFGSGGLFLGGTNCYVTVHSLHYPLCTACGVGSPIFIRGTVN